MKPVRTVSSNFVYRGPAPDIGDAWVERRSQEHAVYLVWDLDQDEREAIALGGQVKLGIYYMEPIPPVSLEVVMEEKIIDANPGHRINVASSDPVRNREPQVVEGYVNPDGSGEGNWNDWGAHK